MAMKLVAVGSVVALTLLGAACMGGGIPAVGGSRESGQSKLMDQTFAGKNKCDPKSHDRPFIIEWDATDMSSFESHAANDIVIVRYEGCEMKVLDKCRDDSVRGSFGTYKPVEWTSGSLEKLDISDEGELYAKLPLGVASLGGRVKGGEKFHMEYYVAGTRNATRDSVYRNDISKTPGCEGATHFVYGYNLGAFALGTAKEISASAEGSVYGFGAGGSKTTKSQADKKGGDLGVCKADSAKEIEGCKVPIRLTLRDIKDGENPEKTAQKAPDTAESLNAAGKVDRKIEMSKEAMAHYESAVQKLGVRDGKGCLAEFDAHDKLDPKNKSTDPKSSLAHQRGFCLMLSGQCPAGKTLVRKYHEAHPGPMASPEETDRTVEAMTGLYCQGGNMTPRDQMIKALQAISQGGMAKKDSAFCMDAYNTVRRVAPQVKPKDDDDMMIKDWDKPFFRNAAQCFVKAGDCANAWKVFQESYPPNPPGSKSDPKTDAMIRKTLFDSMFAQCKK